MSDSPSSEEVTGWHRRFAIACNNRAWDLSERARSATEDQEMLNVAHASAWHWARIGVELNSMRATMLLAEVHALLGFGRSAFVYAEQMRTYFLGIETSPSEIAFVHVIHAHAALIAGEGEKYRSSYALAVSAVAAVPNEKERSMVARALEQVPKP